MNIHKKINHESLAETLNHLKAKYDVDVVVDGKTVGNPSEAINSILNADEEAIITASKLDRMVAKLKIKRNNGILGLAYFTAG